MKSIAATVKSVLFQSGAIALARAWGPGGSTLPILRYHSVSTRTTYCSPSIAVTPEAFRDQMAYLAAHYRVMRLDEIVRHLEDGRPFPAKATTITFDDGYLDNYDVALPILAAHGLTATFYVATSAILGRESFWIGWLYDAISRSSRLDRLAEAFPATAQVRTTGHTARCDAVFDIVASEVDRSDLTGRKALLKQLSTILDDRPPAEAPSDFMMRSRHVQEMARAGMTIASHTSSHPILASLPEHEALSELADSKRQLEEVLQAPVDHIAYPNGPGVPINFNQDTCRLTRQAGYRSASTSVRGPVTLDADLFALPRQGINDRLDLPAFAFKVEEHRFGPLLRA